MISPVQVMHRSFGALYIKSDVRDSLENSSLDKVRQVKVCADRLSDTKEWNAVLEKDSVKIFSNDGSTLKSPFYIKRDKVRPYILHIGDENNLVYSDIFREKVFDCDSKHLEITLNKDFNSTAAGRLLVALESLSPLKQATEIISYLENKNGLFDRFIQPPEERQHVEKVAVKNLVNDLFEKHGVE